MKTRSGNEMQQQPQMSGQPRPQQRPPQQGQSRPQQRPVNQQQRPNQGQQVQGQQQRRPQQGQSRPQQGQQRHPVQQQPVIDNYQGFEQFPKKKSPVGKVIIILLAVLIILIIAMLAVKSMNAKKKAQQEAELAASAIPTVSIFDNLLTALHSHDATAIDATVGFEDGDSYLAQEWAYVNRVPLREEYIGKIWDLTNLVQASDGSLTATVPDYVALQEKIKSDDEYIKQLYKSSGYVENNYTYQEDLFNLYCQYMVDRVQIPTKTVTINIPLVATADGSSVIADDSILDDLLFGNDDFHECCKLFSQICLEFDGKGTETYITKEEVHNDEYDAWFDIFIKYYEADGGSYNPTTGEFKGGKFNPRTSKWEPWYVRDENNNIIYNEDGTKKVNYYSVKDADGNDWIQPAETILTEVEKTREISIPWEEERGIPYVMVGTNFLQNKYDGDYPTVFRVGDGSRNFPAGIGTTIVTKVLCDDNKYHNVRVALTGYWTDEDAINYAESFSSKNRGFTTSSPVKLICFELTVENLEEYDITFKSEMTLCDDNSNPSSRTGTLYGFYEEVTLEPGELIKINDWASSTELNQKYVAWGKSFDRNFPYVYFNVLAGTGNIPSYSAYEQFTGKPQITEAAPEETKEPELMYTDEEIKQRAQEIAEEMEAEEKKNR